MGLSSVTTQAELIRKDIQKLGPYEADVWFSEVISRIPGSHNLSLFPPIPPSPLMQKVKEEQHISVIGKGGHPKRYAGAEPPFIVAYPLMVKDYFMGIIQIARSDSLPFNRDEIDMLEGLSANVAMALQVSHQTIIKNWRWEQLSLVRSVSEQIANVVDLDDLCRKVTELIRDTFHYYAVNIFTIDPGSEQLRFHACAGPLDVQTGSTPVIAAQVGKGIVGKVATEGTEVLANDVKREPLFIYVEQLPLTRAEVVLPLKVEDRILGVLDIQSDHIYAFHEMDMVVLRSLADNIALAVEGARLYKGVERRAEQLGIVSDVGKALSSILDFDQLMEQIVNIITERFGFPFVHLFLVEKDNHRLVYKAGSGGRAESYGQMGLCYDIDDTQGIIPWVARNGATIIANDVAQDPHYRPATVNPGGTVSEMAVPLIFGGEVLGVLDIQSDAPNRFDHDDRTLFETLCDSIAIAIRNSILFNSEKWRREASDSLREVAGLLPNNIALTKLMDVILSELEQILPCDAAAIWLVDPDHTENDGERDLQLSAVHGAETPEIVEACCNEPICVEWLKHALDLDQPSIRTPQDPYGPLGRALGFESNYSSIAAPMRVGDKPVGLITLAHKSPNRYGIESVQMTSAFANYAAVAIQNSQLFSSAQEQAWIATVLLQVAEATQSITTVEELLQVVVRLTPMLVGVEGCALFLWEENMETFSLAGSHGIRFAPEFMAAHPFILPEEVPVLLDLSLTKRVIEVTNPAKQIPILVDPLPKGSYLLMPLLSRGKLMGGCLVALSEVQSGTSEVMAGERKAIIQGIAHQTAIAIENIHLLERQQQETYVSAVLLQVSQTVVSHNELEDVYAAVTPIIPMLVGSKVCLLFLWNAEQKQYYLVQSAGLDRVSEEKLSIKPTFHDQARLLEHVCIHNQTRILPLEPSELDQPSAWVDLDPQLAIADEDVIRGGKPVLVGVPLGVKDDNYGAMLVVDSGEHPRFFSKRLEILTGIAQQTAMAIQNDRLQKAVLSRERLEREFQLAREIQQTFLPEKLPEPEEWQVDARWRPAREVGGDFYDLFWLSKHQLAMVIADVSDKGISAALYMTLTRTVLRTISQQHLTPAEVLVMVNELLLRDTPHGMFVTSLLGFLEVHTGKLVYANAGHNLPIIWRKNEANLEMLQKGGMPLGIIENVKFVDHEIRLEHGDTLLLYTDGITDTYSEKGMFGEERLQEAVRGDDRHTAVSLLQKIDLALMEFQGTAEPADDVTALAVHRK
jgi:serine phosphatase RsbU (regulator of sigma subunit)/putative methionine-R-sulfoxide reductase with GAF domain